MKKILLTVLCSTLILCLISCRKTSTKINDWGKEELIEELSKKNYSISLRDDTERWIGCPVSISGMMVSSAKADSEGNGISIRHPLLKRIRENDISKEDCTLAKIFNDA